MKGFKSWIRHLHSRFWCLYQSCGGYTGTYANCINCPAYHPNKTNCEIKDDKENNET